MSTLNEEVETLAGGHLAEMSPDQEDLLKTIVMVAENEGKFYKTKDAKGAVDYAIKAHIKQAMDDLKHDLGAIRGAAAKEVAAGWKRK